MGTKKIYVNGVLKGTQTNTTTQISPVHQNFYIGGWEGVTTNMRMNGKIDDLRVYNIELTQANVTAIYNSGSGDIGNLVTNPSLQITAPSNGERVLFWADLSKEQSHARITNVRTSGREPHFKTNAQNGLPAVSFADDYLAISMPDSRPYDGLETYTFLVVAKGNNNREDWRPVLSKRGDGGQGWQFRTRGGDPHMTLTTRGTTGTDDPDANPSVSMRGQWHFWTLRYDGLKKLQRGDGVTEYNLDDSGAIAPAPGSLMTLGARHDGGTNFNNRGVWEIGEVLFFDRAVTDDEMHMLENYLSNKWNLPLNSAHPKYGQPVDFSNPSVGVDVSIYWGLSDGGENAAAWDNVAPVGKIYQKIRNDNQLDLFGYNWREEAWLDIQDGRGLLEQSPSGKGTLTSGPGGRGWDFNNDTDFRNAGMGINQNDNFTSYGSGYFTAKVAGEYEFGYRGVDDRSALWIDLDQDGVFSRNGANGNEFLMVRSWAGWAINEFPDNYHWNQHYKTVTLQPGDYRIAGIQFEYGGGSGIDFRFKTPGGVAGPSTQVTVKPSDSAQAGLWSTQSLSNGAQVETQRKQLSLLQNLIKNKTYYYRAFGSNSKGSDWADSTDTFVTENKLDFNYGTLTFDTSAATWSHSSGRSGTGTISTESWTSPTGDTLGFKKTKYTFDSIKLHGNLVVELKGANALSLNTSNHGDIEILVDLNASGGAGTGAEALNSGNGNFGTGGRAPGGLGRIGGGGGGASVNQNGQGRPGGEPTNLHNTVVNAGGGYSNTAWELEVTGGGGSYAGKGTAGNFERNPVAGETFGDRKLDALIGGAGGSGASGWWDGGQNRERAAGAGGGGGGALELVADGNGSVTIGAGVKILADGGDIPDTATDTDGWRGGNGGGGSGGAIRIEGNNVTNNGFLSVTGGDRYHNIYGGAGGGGRIALISRKALVPGQYDISGGRDNGAGIIAGDGTFYVEATEGGMSSLNAVSGSVVIDSSAGTLIYSGPAGSGLAFGTIEDKILPVNGVDQTYAVATYVFDSITLGSSVIVQVKGSNSVLLKTRNHGDIAIDASIYVDGQTDGSAGAGGYRGGASGGNGQGPGGATAATGSGGSYASAGVGEPLPVIYGDSFLAALIGGSGGRASQTGVGGGGGGAIGFEANQTGDVTIGSSTVISARGGASELGGGSGGAILIKGDVVTNNGSLRASGGSSSAGTPLVGGGGRIAVHTPKLATFGILDAGTGSVSVVGDMGIKTLEFSSGKLIFDTVGATWYHSAGTHGMGTVDSAYNFNGKTVPSAVFSFEKIDLGSDLEIVVQGINGLVLKETNSSGINIKADMSQDVVDSGISIESGGLVTIGRDDGTSNTVTANGTRGTLQIRGQGIVNKGNLEAKGTDGRLILAYESSFFNYGTLDYTEKIEMTRPQVTGVLDANVSYSSRTGAVGENALTAWFRFEETSGTTTNSDFGGFVGMLQGRSGNLPSFTSAGKFGGAVEFTMNEWILTDAYADTLDIDGDKPRSVSIWFMPYAAQNNEGEAGLYSLGGHHNNWAPLKTEWAIRGFWGGGSTRFRSQHYAWDVEVEVAEGMDDRWVHLVSTYDGTVLNHWVDGVKRRINAQGWGTDKVVSIYTDPYRPTGMLRFGLWSSWTDIRRTFNGKIDDFRVYNKVLTQNEISALYNNGNGDGVNEPPPVHYTIQGSESPDSFIATGLPSGLTVDARTGKIVGSTTVVGDFNVTIKAGNFLGYSPEQTLVLHVKPIPPTFSPVVTDLTASNVLGTSATINFKIDDFGGEDSNVTVYFDDSNTTESPNLGWKQYYFTGDSDCGVSSSFTYTCAVNVNGSDKTVNGVLFKGETGTSGTGWAFTSGLQTTHGSQGSTVTGQIGQVLSNGMRYNGDPQNIKVTGLTDGQYYKFTLYSQSWGDTEGRQATITCTDLEGSIVAYQDFATIPDGLIVECYYKATGTEAEFSVNPEPGSTWHIYGFSNREAGRVRDAQASQWSYSFSAPTLLGAGTHNVSLTGLTLDSTYHFRVAGTNSGGTGWTSHAGSFKTNASLLSPVVSVYDANTTTFTQNGATLIGRLNSFDGNDAPTVTVYYGLVDQNLSDSGWDGSAVVGQVQAGSDFSKAVSGLQSGKKYFYRAKAANNAGTSISATSGIFVTLGSPDIETAVASDVSPSSATINAKVVSTGGTTIVYPGKITPTTFPDKELGIHFDASAIQGLSNLANVTQWKDISGKARHMNNIRNNPRWIAAEPSLNNKPVVDFNDAADRMWTSYNFRSGTQWSKWRLGGWTAIAVARYTAGLNGDSERLISSKGGNWLFGFHGQMVNRHHFDGWVDSGDAHDNDWHLFSVVHQGKSDNPDPQAWTYDLGASRVSANSGSNNDWHFPQQLEFGAYNDNGENSKGQIAEFIMYYGMLSDEQRQKIESHLAYKYGLELDTNHAFGHQIDALEETVDIGGAPTTVTLYWGTADGATGTWQNTEVLSGTHDKGVVGKEISGLSNGTTYYYRAKASNSVGTVWASETKSFKATNTLLNKDSVPDLVLWLSSDDVDGNGLPDSLADGSFVEDWKDKSNGGYLVQQASGSSARPTFKSQAIGSRGVIRFDGLNDNLYVTSAIQSVGDEVSVFVVAQREGGLDAQTNGQNARILGSSEFDLLAGSANGFAPKIFKFFDANKTIMNVKFGREDLTQSDFFQGDIAEVLVFNRYLTSSESLKVEGYLAHKWRATDTLVPGHPYKEIAPAFDNSPYLKLVSGVEGFAVPSRVGLLGEWLFDQNDSRDTSGNEYNGTMVGGSFTTDTPLGSGSALNLTAGDHYVHVDDRQNQTVFTGRDAFTISTWVKRDPDGGWEPWISKRGEGGRGWQLRRAGGWEVTFTTNGPSGGDGNLRNFYPADDNAWRHIVAVHGHAGSKQRIYVDGEKFLEQDRSGNVNYAGARLVFGARQNTNNVVAPPNSMQSYARTFLDDIRYYNRALSQNEVEVLFGSYLNKIAASYGSAFSYQVQANRGPDAYAVTSGALPGGLELNATTGMITGTPNATGDFTATLKVSNSSGEDSRQVHFRVARGTQTLTFSPDFSGITYGDANMTLQASSDVAGRTFYYGSTDETVAGISGDLFQVASVTDGLVAHLRFDETTGTTAVNEVSSSNGTLNNMTNADWVTGKFGNALDFDGSDDYVELPKDVGELSNLTVSVWLKPTDLRWGVIASKVPAGNSGGKGWMSRFSNSSELRFRLGGASGSNNEIASDVSQFTTGNWFHYAASFDKITRIGKVYKNGTVVKTQNMGNRSPAGGDDVLWIGRSENYSAAKYKGLMDDFRIYDRALTDAEVSTVYGSDNGDFTLVRTGNQLSFKKAGQANIYAVAIGDANVAQSSIVSRPLIIEKPSITITADDKSRMVGANNPAFTYVATGFVNGEDENVFTTAPTLTPTDNSGSAIPDGSNTAGTFSIKPSGAVADNYNFVYVDGIFIVDSRTAQTLSWDQNLSAVSFGNTVELNATASSNLAVTYDIGDESIASLVVTRDYHLDAWWRLDENGSVTQGADSAGNSRLLSTYGPTWTLGKFRNGLSFDGTDDWAQAFGYKGITGGDKRTYSFWLKTSGANQGILYSGNHTVSGSFAFSLVSGKLKVDYGNGSVLSNASLNDNAWHQVVVTLPYSGTVGDTKIYVDGAISTGAATNGTNAVATASTSNVILGKVGTSYFNGMLDDVRIYTGDLKESGSDLEVTAIYGGSFGDFNKIRIIGTGSTTLTAFQPGSSTYAPALPLTKSISVSKQDQTITFSPFPPKSVGDFDFDPGATASSGELVTYSSSDSTIAQIVDASGNPDPAQGGKIRIRKAGTVTITATQSGNAIYNPVTTGVTQTLTINYYNLFEDSISGMQWWFDAYNVNADSSPDVVTDQSAFFNWNDKSSNTRNATQGTSSLMALYNANGLDSKATIKFDAADTLDLPSTAGTKMVFAVMKQDSTQSAETLPFGGDLVGTTSGGKWGVKRSGVAMLDSAVAANAWAVIVYKASAGDYAIYVNGEEKVTGTDVTGISALDKIGGTFQGEIAEVVAYDRVLPDLAREKIEAYMAHKWGLEALLPSTHKYAIALPTFGGAQEIAFQPLSDKTPISSPFTVFAESSSGLPVTFESNDTARATVSGNTVTIVSGATPGTVGIKAKQAGDENWFPAELTNVLNITTAPRADQYIVFGALPSKNVQSANFTLSAVSRRVDNNNTTGLPITYTSSNPAVATVSGNTVDVIGFGVTTIRASQDGNASYNPASFVEQDLTVTKVPQTITFNSLSDKLLSLGTFELNATASSGLPITYEIVNTSIATVSNNVVSLQAGGTTTVKAKQLGDSTYAAASDVLQTLTVIDDSLQPQSITWSQDLSSVPFSTTDLNMTASATSGMAITYSSSDESIVKVVNGTFLQLVGGGTAVVSASQPGNQVWQAASMDKNVTIVKINQVIVNASNGATIPNFTKDLGDFEFDPGAKAVKQGTTTPTGLDVLYTTSNANIVALTAGGTKIVPVGKGTATITANQVGNAGYNAAPSKTFTVTVTEFSPYPDSFSGFIMWLDAKDVNGDGLSESAADFPSVSGKTQPTSWADLSLNSNTMAQSDTSKQPVYLVEGGLPVLAFGGTQGNSGAYMTGNMPAAFAGNSGFTMVVAMASAGSLPDRVFSFGSPSGTGGQIIGLGRDGGFYFNNAQNIFNSSLNAPVQIGAFRRKAGTTYGDSEFMLNGQNLIGSGASGTPNLPSSGGEILLGAGRSPTGALGNFLNAKVHEVMVFTGALNDYAVRRAEGYLAWKWGSQSRLVSGHPFETHRPVFGGDQNITVAANNLAVDPSDNLPYTSKFDDPFELEGSYATSGLDLVYTTSNASVMTVTGGKLDPVAAGTVTVYLNQPGDTHFTAAAQKSIQIKVLDKRSQAITFAQPSEQSRLDILELNASSDSGLPVSFQVSYGSSIATVFSGNKVKFSGTGAVTVRATQAGNSEYAAAVPFDRTFYVKRPLTLIFDPIGKWGRGQSFPCYAMCIDPETRKPLPFKPTFSITTGDATVNAATGWVTTGTTLDSNVTVTATVSNASYVTTVMHRSFIIGDGLGQYIVAKQGERGGLRDLPLSRKPIPIGRMVSASSGYGVTVSVPGDLNPKTVVQASPDGKTLGFTKGTFNFGSDDYITLKIKLTQPGNYSGAGTYYAAADIIREIRVMKPGKKAWLEERRWDVRYPSERTKFARRVYNKRSINGLDDLDGDGSTTIADAALLFDSDDADSDGDGVNNLLERAFGSDSLTYDRKASMPRIIKKKDGKQRITFLKYQDIYAAEEGLQYVVERSKDLRKWTTAGMTQIDLNGANPGKGKDVGGGMERVTWVSDTKAKDQGGKQYLRVRIRTK